MGKGTILEVPFPTSCGSSRRPKAGWWRMIGCAGAASSASVLWRCWFQGVVTEEAIQAIGSFAN